MGGYRHRQTITTKRPLSSCYWPESKRIAKFETNGLDSLLFRFYTLNPWNSFFLEKLVGEMFLRAAE